MRNLMRYIVGALFLYYSTSLWAESYNWPAIIFTFIFGLTIAGDILSNLLINHFKNNP